MNPFHRPTGTRVANGQFARLFPDRRLRERRSTLAAKWAADHAAMCRIGVKMSEESEYEATEAERVRREIFEDALCRAMEEAQKVDFATHVRVTDLQAIADCFEDVEARHWMAATVTEINDSAELDLNAMGAHLVWTCAEFAPIRPIRHRIRWVWRLSKWMKSGRAKAGEARKIPSRQRDLDPSADYEITVNLPLWLGLDRIARERLVHHELMHILGWVHIEDGEHHIMEFGETLQRYGIGDPLQAKALASFMARPASEAECRRYGFDPISGQGLLFGAGGKVEVPDNAATVSLATVGKSITINADDAVKVLDRIKRL